MKYVGIGFIIGIAGYVLTAFLSYYLIGKFSANGHDRSVEASMTSIFVYGPMASFSRLSEDIFWQNTRFKPADYVRRYLFPQWPVQGTFRQL